MQTIQIAGYTADEFRQLIKESAADAAREVIETLTKVKQDMSADITVTEIAQSWGCSKMTVTRRIKQHKVPTVKLGREVAIKKKFLETIKNPLPKE